MNASKLPRKLRQFEPVEVTWEDVWCDNGHVDSKNVVIRPAIRKTLGYVLAYTDRYLVVADTDDRNSQISDGDFEQMNQIPRAYIVSIKRLGPSKC